MQFIFVFNNLCLFSLLVESMDHVSAFDSHYTVNLFFLSFICQKAWTIYLHSKSHYLKEYTQCICSVFNRTKTNAYRSKILTIFSIMEQYKASSTFGDLRVLQGFSKAMEPIVHESSQILQLNSLLTNKLHGMPISLLFSPDFTMLQEYSTKQFISVIFTSRLLIFKEQMNRYRNVQFISLFKDLRSFF